MNALIVALLQRPSGFGVSGGQRVDLGESEVFGAVVAEFGLVLLLDR